MIPKCSVKGKVAIITGSSQGIGNTLAKAFAEAGASVVLVARRASLLEDTVTEIKANGGKALASPADIIHGSQVSQVVKQTIDVFSRIDVLINCAGGTAADRFIPLIDMEEDVWDRIVDLNLRATYLFCRAVGPVMVDQKNGSVINFSAGASTVPVSGLTHYCAAKAGINHFTRTLAVEWGRHNIRVNAISPGLTDTPGERDHMPPDLWEQYSRLIPMGRTGQPQDMIGTALFLASESSAFVNGVIIPVGGGPQ